MSYFTIKPDNDKSTCSVQFDVYYLTTIVYLVDVTLRFVKIQITSALSMIFFAMMLSIRIYRFVDCTKDCI